MDTPSLFPSTFTDVRQRTLESRLAIGFGERDAWQNAPAFFSDHTLVINGHPVMEDWEDGYMRELARVAASRGGPVLEVGYGMGISAGYLQQHAPGRHIVIEANQSVYERLLAFAAGATHRVEPLFGFWEDVTRARIPSGSLSGILFDTYPIEAKDIHRNHFPFFQEAYRMLAPGGVLTYYSDEIDDFSPEHRRALMDAGFTNIGKNVCTVTPPVDCAYWKSPTIVAPIIIK